MAKIKVINAVGTSDLVPKDGSKSWIEYWLNYGGRNIFRLAYYASFKCPVCKEIANDDKEVGAHVIRINDKSKRLYIVPLCKKCNKRTDVFSVDDFFLVPVIE